MCGIAGQIQYNGYRCPPEALLTVREKLSRRGPDQNGLYTSDHAALMHTRLCVVDLVHGKQPMSVTLGGRSYHIVYNGELYNTEELRRELTALGHRFHSHSDTEVALHAYIQWGEGCPERFNGIFAFAVWDEAEDRLFIARDRMGVKPFFYVYRDQVFLFASELKALLAHPLVEPVIGLEGVCEIMLIGPGRSPGCGVFKQIHELPRASCGFVTRDGVALREYWQLSDREHTETLEETIAHVRELTSDAIRRQLVSDVPLCTFLSGGLDSSIISSLSAKYLKEQGQMLHTFSVDYVDNDKYFKSSKFQPNSDNAYIDAMTRYLGVPHHRITIDTPELVDALFEAVDARDLPGMTDVDSSLLLFCRAVKEHATVALSGECADEIFGGYPWYRDPEVRATDGFPWAQSTAYRAAFLQDGLRGQIDPQDYVYSRYLATIRRAPKRSGLTDLESRMKEMMLLNVDWFMQTLLDRKDRMSMYSGLEVRVPFCDWRIVDYLYSVPWEYKDDQGREKGLLRRAMEGYLPESVLWRKKSPYPKTHNPSYLQAVSERLREVLADPNAPLLQLVKKSALESLLTADRATPWYGQLMTTPQTIAYFLQLDYWLRTYRVRIEL